MTSLTREAVAYHEAGHAVMAVLLGMKLEWVTIIPRKKGTSLIPGRTKLRYFRTPKNQLTDRAKSKILNHIRVILAGPAAQRQYSPETLTGECISSDAKQVEKLTLACGLSSDGMTVQRQQLRFVSFVIEGNWKAVEAVAKALLIQERLSGDEVKEIVSRIITEQTSDAA